MSHVRDSGHTPPTHHRPASTHTPTVIHPTAPKPRDRILVLRYWEQMSTDETATALGMAPGTVKSTLRR
ncbi:RNA polymerase sigma factor, partial [Streptomyces mirabilis]|uniref:RNA polymerase sigma factor n=1 Tax=Streptomyces mirabilis TaxID=68239 RepID=UPI0036D7DDA9